jgi:hypothetical protein
MAEGAVGDSSGRGGVPEIQGWEDGRKAKKTHKRRKKGFRAGRETCCGKGTRKASEIDYRH